MHLPYFMAVIICQEIKKCEILISDCCVTATLSVCRSRPVPLCTSRGMGEPSQISGARVKSFRLQLAGVTPGSHTWIQDNVLMFLMVLIRPQGLWFCAAYCPRATSHGSLKLPNLLESLTSLNITGRETVIGMKWLTLRLQESSESKL